MPKMMPQKHHSQHTLIDTLTRKSPAALVVIVTLSPCDIALWADTRITNLPADATGCLACCDGLSLRHTNTHLRAE
jgi:hypothetical protein